MERRSEREGEGESKRLTLSGAGARAILLSRMATLNTLVRFAALIGGELTSLFRDQNDLTVTYKHDVSRAVSTTAVTLWDSSTDSPSTFDAAAVVMDPDDVLTSNDTPTVEIEVTAAGVVVVFKVSKEHPPLVIPGSIARASIGGSDLAVTKIRAKASAGTIKVRCLVVD
jgi:hypothetical protein